MKKYAKLNAERHIKSVGDVRVFFNDLMDERMLIHPEDSFEDYNLPEDVGAQMMSHLDSIMEECHAVCGKANVDICEVALEELDKRNKEGDGV